jgi:hypothetical protein
VRFHGTQACRAPLLFRAKGQITTRSTVPLLFQERTLDLLSRSLSPMTHGAVRSLDELPHAIHTFESQHIVS